MSQSPDMPQFELNFENTLPSRFRGAHIIGEPTPVTDFVFSAQDASTAGPLKEDLVVAAEQVIQDQRFMPSDVSFGVQVTAKTWQHDGRTFKNETLPDFSAASFEEIMKDPAVQASVQRYMDAILSGEVDKMDDQVVEFQAPYIAEAADLESIAPLKPHEVDITFMAEETAAARGALSQFDKQTIEFQDASERYLKHLISEVVAVGIMNNQLSNWGETARQNNATLDELLVEQQTDLVEQARKCDELFQQGEIIEGQLSMFSVALEDAGAKSDAIKREIDEAQARSNQVQRRYRQLSTRTQQLLDVCDVEKSAIKESDVKSFLGEEVLENIELKRHIERAIQNPLSTEASYVRELIVGSFTGQSGQEGIRDRLLKNSLDISNFIKLKHTYLQRHDNEVAALLEQQAELGKALTSHVQEQFNPALEELALRQQALTESQALAKQRIFAATPIPTQLEAVQRQQLSSHRAEALRLEQAGNPSESKAITMIDREAGERSSRVARRKEEKKRKGLLRKLGSLAKLDS